MFKKRMTAAVKQVLRSLGCDITRFQAKSHPLAHQIDLVRRLGIDLVLDVGANNGIFGKKIRAQGYQGRIISFEPISEVYQELGATAASDPNWDVVNAALGDVAGEQVIHVSRNSCSSSLLPVTDVSVSSAPASEGVRDERIRVARLDDELSALTRGERSIWLKTDTQGFEMQVLRGAEGSIEQVSMMQLEMCFAEMYSGQSLFGELYQWAVDRGFKLSVLDFQHWHPVTGELLFLDGLFHRPNRLVSC